MLSLSWPRTVTLASLQRGNDGNWRVAHVVGVRHGGEAEHRGRLAAHAARAGCDDLAALACAGD